MAKDADTLGIGDFVKNMKSGLNRCLDPTMTCENPAIRAHSVQNATALELLVEDGHVVTIKQSLKKGVPFLAFERVGRNQASTFTGFCSQHDNDIFNPIDVNILSLNNPEQLFLLAYRSVTRELHAVLEGAGRIQSAYLTSVDRGKILKDVPSPAGIEAVQHMLKAWGTWRYRYRHFDTQFENGRFDEIRHTIITLPHDNASIAASSFFSAQDKVWGRPFPATIVNIVPMSIDETAVIVSYAREHSGVVRRLIAPITLERDPRRQRLLLSHMIVNRMENFFIRPSIVASWSPEKTQFILDSFGNTIFSGASTQLDQRLMLFPD